MGLVTVGIGVSLTLACSWDSSFYWVALANLHIRSFVLSYCILFCCVWLLSLGGLFFSEGKWGWEVNLGERESVGELGGVERRETLVGIYYIREKSIFSLKKKLSLQQRDTQKNLSESASAIVPAHEHCLSFLFIFIYLFF